MTEYTMSGHRFVENFKSGGKRDQVYARKYGGEPPLDKEGNPTLGWCTYNKATLTSKPQQMSLPKTLNVSRIYKDKYGHIKVDITDIITSTNPLSIDRAVQIIQQIIKNQ